VSDTTRPKAFFAYPSQPASCSEVIATAAEDLRAEGIEASTWQELNVGGRILVERITSAIDNSDIVIAEVSSMNRNVLFEAGYALAKNKQLLLAIDESLESAHRLWEGVQLFSTIGRLEYHGNGKELARLIREAVAATNSGQSLLTAILADAKEQQANAVFAPTVPVRFQAADMLDKELNNRGGLQVLASGDDLGLAPLSYYAGEIYRSSAAIFHLMNPDRTRATEHNARSSFLAGFALGWERPILMLAETQYLSPLDYRDLLVNYQTAAQMVRFVNDWLSSLPLKTGTSRRLGRWAMDLSLPVASFGQYVAENEDTRLDDYFLPTSEFGMLLQGEASVFVGRKGTGKTANMLQAAADLDKDRRNLVLKVKPTSYELAGLVELVERFDLRSGSEYLLVNLWVYLLSTEVAIRLIEVAESSAAGLGGSAAAVQLGKRLDVLRVDQSLDLASRLEAAVDDILTRVTPSASDQDLRIAVGGALGVRWFKDLYTEIREASSHQYQRIAILVDNLDKAWDKGTNFEATSKFLLALLNASGQVRRGLGRDGVLTTTLSVFLRADIYEVMTKYAREPDKIGPLMVQWNDPYLLARVLEDRYAANVRRKVDNDMWATIFPEEVHGLPAREYILWRILPRPRDIIFYGNAALTTAINRRHAVITQDDIMMADDTYSRFAFDALVVESEAQGFDLEELLFNFAGTSATLSESELDSVFQESVVDGADAKSWLLRTSFLGIEVKDGKFIHVEGQSEVDKKTRVARRLADRLARPQRYRVHPAFRNYLDIRDDDLHTPGVEDITLTSAARSTMDA